MTIRYRLLSSYIFISLTSSILITLMFFMHFSSVLTEEIESNLKIEALSMMQEIDWHVFERIQNIMIWKNLEVMQDIRVQDIDKRLAYFLREISQGYQGMYPFYWHWIISNSLLLRVICLFNASCLILSIHHGKQLRLVRNLSLYKQLYRNPPSLHWQYLFQTNLHRVT